MQDFIGVPAVVDGGVRETVKRLSGDTSKVNPLSPRFDLVIDHSVTVDHFGDDDAFERKRAAGNGT